MRCVCIVCTPVPGVLLFNNRAIIRSTDNQWTMSNSAPSTFRRRSLLARAAAFAAASALPRIARSSTSITQFALTSAPGHASIGGRRPETDAYGVITAAFPVRSSACPRANLLVSTSRTSWWKARPFIGTASDCRLQLMACPGSAPRPAASPTSRSVRSARRSWTAQSFR